MRLHVLLPALIAASLLIGCPPSVDDDDGSEECNYVAGDAAPEVDIQDPDNALELGPNDPINWVVLVQDEDSEVTDLELEAVDMSNGTEQELEGGPFDIPSPNSDGRVVFSMDQPDTIGTGVITLRIWARDPLGCEGNNEVVVCVDVPAAECDFL